MLNNKKNICWDVFLKKETEIILEIILKRNLKSSIYTMFSLFTTSFLYLLLIETLLFWNLLFWPCWRIARINPILPNPKHPFCGFFAMRKIFFELFFFLVRIMIWTNKLDWVPPSYSFREFSHRINLLMYIASMVMSFSTMQQTPRIFHSTSCADSPFSARCWPTWESFPVVLVSQ